jgi:hypothetical protein
MEWMKEAYRLTRKDGAPGIDGVTAADYATNLEANLLDLLDRIKSGRYKAPPVYWASALHGMGYHSIPTRRASLISATTGQVGLTIRRRMVPRSPSSAALTPQRL